MHKNNRKKFINNYKFINIHKYTNCLSGTNKNKIENYVKHYCKKHNILYTDIKVIPNFKCLWNNYINVYESGCIYIKFLNHNRYISMLKLICEQNEIILTTDINTYNKIYNYYILKEKTVKTIDIE